MKARVERNPDGQWQATRPRLGFAGPEVRTFPTHRAAMSWIDQHISRQSSLAAVNERAPAQGGVGQRTYGYNRDMHIRA